MWTLTLGSGQDKPQTGPPSPGILCIGDKPLSLLAELLGQIEGLEKPRFHSWGVHRFFPRGLPYHWLLHHAPQSEPSEHLSLTHSMPYLGTGSRAANTWEKTWPRDAEVTQSWDRAQVGVAVIVGAYSSSAPEAAQTSESSAAARIPTAALLCTTAHSTAQCGTRPRVAMTGKTQPWDASKQNFRHLHRQSIGPLWAHEPHLLQHSPPLGQSPQYREKENYKRKGNRVSLSLTLRASTRQLESRPHSWQGGDSHWAEEVLPHNLHKLQLLHLRPLPLIRWEWPKHPE